MILGEERLDQTSPDEQDGDAADEGGEVGAEGAESGGEWGTVAATDEGLAEGEAALAGDEDGGDFDDAVGEEPAEEKNGLASADVIEGDEAEDDAVVKEENDRSESVGHAEGECLDGDADIIDHQLGGEDRVFARRSDFASFLFHGDAFGGVGEEGAKHFGEDDGLGLGIEKSGETAEEATDEGDDEGEIKGLAMFAEDAGKFAKEPVEGAEPGV